MSDLHVFRNAVIDWIVAADVDDARLAYGEYMKAIGGDTEDDDDLEWIAEPDDKVLAVTDEDEGRRIEKTCATWAREHGRGFLCSTEF